MPATVSSHARKLKWDHDGTKATEKEVLELLYGLVRSTKPTRVVETGTFAGHGAKAISEALQANEYGCLWSVEADPELASALADVTLPRTNFIEGDSLAFIQGIDFEPDLLFVDCGEPEHRAVVATEGFRRLSPEGLLLVHDTGFYPGMEPLIRARIGAAQLHIHSLHGVSIWQAL